MRSTALGYALLTRCTISTARSVAHPALLNIPNFALKDLNGFIAGVGATGDSNSGLSDFEMFGEEFDECFISFAVVGFGTKVDS